LLFEVRRGGREVAGADALGLAHAAFDLALWSEAVEWARYALKESDDPDRAVRAQAVVVAGLYQLNRFDEALEAIRASGDPPAGVDAEARLQLHMNEGLVLTKMGLIDEALGRYALASKGAAHASTSLQAALELNRGTALNELDRNDEAIAAYERALALGLGERAAAVEINLGNALRDLGRYDDAERHYAAANRAAEGDPGMQGSALSNHARLLVARGRSNDAKPMLKDAIALRREAGDPAGEAISAEELAKLLAAEADYRGALKWTHHAVALRRSTGQPDDDWLMEFGASMQAIVEVMEDRPDVGAHSLVDRLRAVVPGQWPQITEGASQEELELAAGRLASELQADDEDDRGRAVEDRWLLELVRRQLAVGHQLALAEHNERMQRLGGFINLVLELLRHDHWIGRKRLYEARRGQFEGSETAELLQFMEGRAGELGLEAGNVADLRALVDACRRKGVDVAFAELPELHPRELINRIMMVGTWRETLHIVEAHPELLSDATIALLEQARDLGPAAGRERAEQHIEVLRRCRTVGVEEAFAEAPALGREPLGLKYDSSSSPVDVEVSEDPVAAARMMATVGAQSGNPVIQREGLIGVGNALLVRAEGDHAANLQDALEAFGEAAAVVGGPIQHQTARIALGTGAALLELASLDPERKGLAVDAGKAYERALAASPVVAAPKRTLAAAAGLYDAVTAHLATGPPYSETVYVRQVRVKACRAAIAATDELVRTGEVGDPAKERARTLWAYRGAVEELCSLGQYAAALATVEHGRARGFLAEIGRMERLPASVPAALAQRETVARDKVRESRAAADADALAAANEHLHAVHAELAAVAPELGRLRSGEAPTSEELTEFARAQSDGLVILAWYTTPAECYAFALHGGSGEVRGARTSLKEHRLGEFVRLAAMPDQPLSPAWRELTDALVPADWREQIAAADEVVLVPHGLLGDIPLHGLPLSWLGGCSLLEAARVEYLPGLALAHRLRASGPSGDLALVLAHAGEPESSGPSEFEREARAVAQTVGTGHVYVGPKARGARLAELGSRASLVHIAAHGAYDAADPLGSVVLLSDGTWEGSESLSARDVVRLPALPSAVVVLSACETNRRGADATGEGEGLTRAFLVAGARAVVAGQWRVDSSSTRALMERFYPELHASGDVAGSLRTAALSLREAPTTSHPYYWAPFVAVGA
jgi:tetratricopeptide (TPR) repeat protein